MGCRGYVNGRAVNHFHGNLYMIINVYIWICVYLSILVYLCMCMYMRANIYIYEYSVWFRIHIHVNRQIDIYDYNVYNMSTYVHIYKCAYICEQYVFTVYIFVYVFKVNMCIYKVLWSISVWW